ncbi:unnamed protein product [Schistosoma margrebowiei]|uniref:Uncharacterized protein n=1 Tax=Schistosoma margrebowiei TaxID=48269 RepID=A0A183MXW2_9TREM|nr:unnamed protein product [Schistosoma margrebowiei]
MQDNRKGVEEKLTSACQEISGRMEEWISIETLYMNQERRNKNVAITNSQTRAEKVKTHGTSYQCQSANDRTNRHGHQTNQEWESSRTRQHTS